MGLCILAVIKLQVKYRDGGMAKTREAKLNRTSHWSERSPSSSNAVLYGVFKAGVTHIQQTQITEWPFGNVIGAL